MDNPGDNTERVLGYMDAFFRAVAGVAGLAWTAKIASRKLKAKEDKERAERDGSLQAIYAAGIEKTQDRAESLIEDYEQRLAKAAGDLDAVRRESRELEREYIAKITELKIENSNLRADLRAHGGKLDD